MARRRGFFNRILDAIFGSPEEAQVPPARPTPIPTPEPEPRPELESSEATWRDVIKQAAYNVGNGESYGDGYSDVYRSYEIYKDVVKEEYGSDISDRDVERIARQRLYDLLNKQSDAFDDYATAFDPFVGQELRAEVESLGLPASVGNYHGNTQAGSNHFYGRHSDAMNRKMKQARS